MEEEKQAQKVVMVPWLAHGHATPYFELAKKLSKHNFQIYLCSTSAVLNFLKHSQENYLTNNTSSSIEFVELHLPMGMAGLPSHQHSTKGLPQHLFPDLIKAFQMAGSALSNLITNLNPDLIISDCFQTWASDVDVSRNVPAVNFFVVSAASCSFMGHLFMNDGAAGYPFPEISLPEYEIEKMRSKTGSLTTFMEGFFGYSASEHPHVDLILINNWKEPEAKYMQYMSFLNKKKIVSVGPLIGQIDDSQDQDSDNIIIQWLDKRDRFSTVYAVFGSESISSKEDIQEIAHGLELSSVSFLWVLRYPGSNDVEQVLPDGFLNRVKERGLVVSKWVPHARIMSHPSIGGFLNHCGWNSTLECMHFGVPLIAMPFISDQFLATKYVVDLGIALEVERDEKGRLKREEIAKGIRNVMLVEKKGEQLREKSKELSAKIRLEEEKEIEAEAVEELRKLCLMKKNEKCIK